MRSNLWRLAASSVLIMSPLTHGADDVPSEAFWEWYMQYADEDGNVFDPLALEELGTLNTAEEQSTDTGQQRATEADGAQEEKAAQDSESEATQ